MRGLGTSSVAMRRWGKTDKEVARSLLGWSSASVMWKNGSVTADWQRIGGRLKFLLLRVEVFCNWRQVDSGREGLEHPASRSLMTVRCID